MAFLAGHTAWTRMEISFDPAHLSDWPQYFADWWFLARIIMDILLALLLVVAATGTSAPHRFFAFLGQMLVGTYLVHLYFRPQLEGMLQEAGLKGGIPLQLFI